MQSPLLNDLRGYFFKVTCQGEEPKDVYVLATTEDSAKVMALITYNNWVRILTLDEVNRFQVSLQQIDDTPIVNDNILTDLYNNLVQYITTWFCTDVYERVSEECLFFVSQLYYHLHFDPSTGEVNFKIPNTIPTYLSIFSKEERAETMLKLPITNISVAESFVMHIIDNELVGSSDNYKYARYPIDFVPFYVDREVDIREIKQYLPTFLTHESLNQGDLEEAIEVYLQC